MARSISPFCLLFAHIVLASLTDLYGTRLRLRPNSPLQRLWVTDFKECVVPLDVAGRHLARHLGGIVVAATVPDEPERATRPDPVHPNELRWWPGEWIITGGETVAKCREHRPTRSLDVATCPPTVMMPKIRLSAPPYIDDV